MADALTIEIVLQSEQAQRAIDNFRQSMEKAGFAADETAEEVKQFEQAYAKAAIAADKAAKATTGAGDAAKVTANDINGLAQQFGLLDGRIGQAVRGLSTLFGSKGALVAAGGVAASAMLLATKASIDYTAGIDKVARQLRITSDEMQGLDFVARSQGIGIDRLGRAMDDLDVKVTRGSQSTVAALSAIGLGLDDVAGLSRVERLRAVAAGIVGMQDPAEQTRVMVDLLGESGTDLIRVLAALSSGAETHAPKMAGAFVEAGSALKQAFDDAVTFTMTRGQQLLSYLTLWPLALAQWSQSVSEALWGMTGALPSTPGRPAMPWSSGPSFDPLNGQSMGFTENRLTQGARSGGRSGNVIDFPPYQFSGGTPMPFRGSLGFPGWAMGATPFGFTGVPFASAPTLAATPFGFLGTGFAPTVGMNAPGGGGGVGSWFRGAGGRAVGMGLGMLSGMMPGMSQMGSSLGSMGGAMIGSIGSLASSTLGSLLGPLGGIVGGLVGKLFGPSEGTKTNRLRDATIQDDWGSVDALREAADAAGFSVDRLLSTKKVKDFQSEYDKLKKAIGDSEADAQRVEEAMSRWGLTIVDMGPKFQQSKINDAFKEATEDLRVLTGAGADFEVVAEKMAPHFGALIQEAIEMGGSVPRELEPILKKMIDLGILTDKNGDKFTELSQIPFAADLNKDFQTLISKMDALIDRISKLPGLFDDAANAAGHLSDQIPGGPSPDAGTPFGEAGAMRAGSAVVVAPTIQVQGYLDSPSAQRNLSALVQAEMSRLLRASRAA